MPITPADRERLRHERRKASIESGFLRRVRRKMIDEGISKAIISVIVTALYAILALIIAPDPTVTKFAAILIALGIGAFAAYAVILVLASSRMDMVRAVNGRDRAERREDDRHRQNLAELS